MLKPWPRLSLSLVLLATLLGGCASYQYIPPATESGRQCVATCETAKQTCSAGAKQVAASKEMACESRASNSVAICLATAKDQAAKEQCNKSRPYCGQVSGEAQCNTSYDRCFTTCGGQIVETP